MNVILIYLDQKRAFGVSKVTCVNFGSLDHQDHTANSKLSKAVTLMDM